MLKGRKVKMKHNYNENYERKNRKGEMTKTWKE